MTKEEIKEAMKIIRPAIIAMYGRQPLKIIGYSISPHLFGYTWFTVEGKNNIYKVKIQYSEIVYLGIE